MRGSGLACALALVVGMGIVSPASATDDKPSEDDIVAAKSAEDATKMSIAEIEVELAANSAALQKAQTQTQARAEDYNRSKLEMDKANAAADEAAASAEQAKQEFEKARQGVASVAQTAYMEGSGSLDSLAPYLASDGLRAVETKQASIDAFGSVAEGKMQRVSALEQVAQVAQNSADEAAADKVSAAEAAQANLQAAQAAADQAAAIQAATDENHKVLVAELAKRQDTTAELVEKRESALEQERQEAAKAAAEAAAQAAAEQAAADKAAADKAAADKAAADKAAAAKAAADQAPATQAAAPASAPAEENTEAAAPQPAPAEEDTEAAAPEPAPAEDYDEAAAPEPAPAEDYDEAAAPEPAPAQTGSGSAQGAIDWARSVIGAPYVWGGEGPGYDCSGLTKLAYASQGISLTHFAQSQYYEGTQVPLSERQPGDLLFWSSDGGATIHHVAIYVGNDMMLEAPTFGLTVREFPIHTWEELMPNVVRFF